MDSTSPSFWAEQLQSTSAKGAEKRRLLKLATQSIDKVKFKDDLQMLQIWFSLIDLERELSQDYACITDIFKYMGSNRIGVKNWMFYVKWAKFENESNFSDRAKRILLAAIQSKVEPIEKLRSALNSLESASAVVSTGKENFNIPSNLSSETRKPLQEKQRPNPFQTVPFTKGESPVPEASSSSLTLAAPSGAKGDPHDTTVRFRARMNRGRGKLGKPERKPRSDVEQEIIDYGQPQQKSFPSPESLNSASPNSSKSSAHNSPLSTIKNPSTSTTTTSSSLASEMSMSNLEMDDSSSDSSLEDLGHGGDVTENMELSQTVTFIGQKTPKPQPSPASHGMTNQAISASGSKQDEDSRNFISIGGKQYIKSGLIGKGGSCKVFKILDPQNGQIFALKRVKLRGQDQSVVDGYKNEILLLDKLKNNDRIIHLYGASHDLQTQTLMMILEFGEIDLEKMMQKDLDSGDGRISINRIKSYWEQMLQAVRAIHSQNIIHSDLKPANFLLVSGSLKLIDFGIAKAIQNDTTNIHRDHQSGTVNYMSPESIMPHVEMPGVNHKVSSKAYLKQGRASDVWSLGCILYRLVYHQPPFGTMQLMVKLVAITNPNHVIPYPPLEKEFVQVIPVLQGCLVFEPKKRLSIQQLLEHEFLRGGGSLSTEAISPEFISRILKRGIELNVNSTNTDRVANLIYNELKTP